MSIREKVLGEEHSDTANSYHRIGFIYRSLGNYKKALEYHFKSLAIREKVLGVENIDTATSYNNIGRLFNKLGEYDKALEYCTKALSIFEKNLPEEHPNLKKCKDRIEEIKDKMNKDKTI